MEKLKDGNHAHDVMACGMDQFSSIGTEYYLRLEFPKSAAFLVSKS